MDDNDLFRFYLELSSPEARQWNLSPENLFFEFITRRRLAQWLRPAPGLQACNVGIGAGEWDDYLGFWLSDGGRLTSIDRDGDCCRLLSYRQRREGHPNPAEVWHRSILDAEGSWGQFDLLTIIGSTLREAGDYEGALAGCLRILKPGGRLFLMDFHRYHPPAAFERFAEERGLTILQREEPRLDEERCSLFLAAEINPPPSPRAVDATPPDPAAPRRAKG